jgi:glyoxylase-like metal-dependent hydrolase (beta-lactamase superfamily II)
MEKISTYGPVLEWCWASDSRLLNALTKPYWLSCYIIDGLMIDSGAPASVTALKSFIRSLGADDAIERCVLTHWHEDHTGGAHMLSGEMHIPVYADPITIAMLSEGFTYPFYRRWTWGTGVAPAAGVMPLPSGAITTRSGDYSFDIVPMPGHADGLFSLVEMMQGWAFTSDAVMPRYSMLFGHTSDIRENIEVTCSSIRTLLDVTGRMKGDVTLFISGHGSVTDGRTFLSKKIEELELMHEKAHELRAQGLTDKQIRRAMFHGDGLTGIITRGELSSLNLVRSLLQWSKLGNQEQIKTS